MRPDTPLPEVAAYLPPLAASLLAKEPPEVQALCCKRIRDAVVFLDTSGVLLDPVQFEGVMTLLVVQDIPVAHEIKALLTQINELRERHGST